MDVKKYIQLAKEASGELWMFYKSHAATGEQPDEWWREVMDGFTGIAEKYRGTVAEKYAANMAVFYLKDVQRLCRMKAE